MKKKIYFKPGGKVHQVQQVTAILQGSNETYQVKDTSGEGSEQWGWQ